MEEGTFINDRGQRLYYRSYKAEAAGHKALVTLVFHHGYGCYCGFYDKDYRTLQKRGFSVFAFDAHSFGKSEPLEPAYMRSYVLSPHHLVDDVYSYVREVVQRYQDSHPGLPMVMGGVSMGGMVATLTVMREQEMWQGLMLLSPAIDVPRTLLLRVMEMLQGLVLPYFPHWRIVPSPPIHVVTEDPKLRQELLADKNIDMRPVRVRTGRMFLDGFAAIRAQEAELDLPIFAAMSPTDQACDFSALKRFLGAVKSQRKDLKVFPGAFHELLKGPEQQATLDAMTEWLLRQSRQKR
ncbi:hypothetical protein CVIRNUC_000786 [Coccomyxa viridis]|uniref:Serine aminopeptidase S33 domain-containing protein n=1 Tax=Coccomyxa viridis TaxID=1274662 RepID=A0AAV1HVA8_9CHLO|nr:hypothetical protein CVIRNUC_000786 [Coccomyxa viridis]